MGEEVMKNRVMDPTAERLRKVANRAAAALHRRLSKGDRMPEAANAHEAAEHFAKAATLLSTCSTWQEES